MRPALLARVALAASTLITVAGPAAANGRFPAAGQLVIDPQDPDRLLLRATYGFVQSSDGGATWSWICEQAIGFSGVEDPAVAYLSEHTVIAGLSSGLSRNVDAGCSWTLLGGALEGEYVIDVSADKNEPSRAIAITVTPIAGGLHSIVATSTDAGATWQQSGAELGTDLRAVTVDAAPSDPHRIYVSGLVEPSFDAVLVRSDDGGATWTRFVHPAITGVPYLSAVDPDDADRIYVCVHGTDNDSVYVSNDGGNTLELLAERPGEMLGFALSPDGSRIAIGGPAFGLQIADSETASFGAVSDVRVRCLTWTATTLYICAGQATDGFTLAASTDDGETIEPLYHLTDLAPLACDGSTPVDQLCPANWPGTADLLGIVTEPPTTSTGGAGGQGAGGAAADGVGEEGGGCCSTAGAASRGRGAALLAFALGATSFAARYRAGRRARRQPRRRS